MLPQAILWLQRVFPFFQNN
ncbi:hypothetical protein YPPY99_2882, partial [Yersinia pestis PY-99]